MTTQDLFLESAEMFSNTTKGGWSRRPMKYRRFESLALAVKFAVEDMSEDPASVIIRTDTGEFTGPGIRKVYDDLNFPLVRGPAKRTA